MIEAHAHRTSPCFGLEGGPPIITCLIRLPESSLSMASARVLRLNPFASGMATNTVRIPTKSAGDSERRRPPVPIEAGRGFR